MDEEFFVPNYQSHINMTFKCPPFLNHNVASSLEGTYVLSKTRGYMDKDFLHLPFLAHCTAERFIDRSRRNHKNGFILTITSHYAITSSFHGLISPFPRRFFATWISFHSTTSFPDTFSGNNLILLVGSHPDLFSCYFYLLPN